MSKKTQSAEEIRIRREYGYNQYTKNDVAIWGFVLAVCVGFLLMTATGIIHF